MRILFSLSILFLGSLLSLIATAATVAGVVESVDGKLVQAGITSCEATVLSQNEESMQVTIKLIRNAPLAVQTQTLTMTKDDLDFLFDIRWDYGATEPAILVPNTSFSTVNTHRIRIEGNEMVYRFRMAERTEDIQFASSDLVCRFPKN